MIAVEGSVTHLDEDVDEHPEADAGSEDGDSNDDKGPGSADERFVAEDRKLLLVRDFGQNVAVSIGRVLRIQY